MKTVVIKLSGSLFTFDNGISNIEKIIKTLEEITINPYNFRVVAVAGGGKLARTIQDVSRSFNADEAFLDQLGIDISRVHAKLLTCTTNSYHDVPQTLDEVIHSISSSKPGIALKIHQTSLKGAPVEDRAGWIPKMGPSD